MSEEKLVPKLRFSGFDDEWTKINLGELSKIGKGFTPSTSNPSFWDGELYWLSIADLNQGKYIKQTSKKISLEGSKNKDPIEKGTLLMSFKLSLGKLGILTKDMYTNEAICNFKWKNNNISTEYMYYYLSSINIMKYGSQAAKGITLNNETLNTIPVILPNFDEQNKISNFLSKIDKKIELLEKKHQAYEDFKKYLMQQIFTQKLRFADYNEYSLKQILEKIENGFSGTQVNYETPFPVTRIETISSGIINYNKVGFVDHIPERYLLKEGDILLTNINSIKWIGNSVYFDGKRVLYHGMNLMLLRSKKEINSKYLYYYITYNNNWFKKMACQAVNQASINKSTLEKFIVKIPDFETQNNIANVLSLTDEKINRISNQVDLTRKFKKGLLQQMFV